MKTVLFLGDSITDWYRRREEEFNLGEGYVLLNAAKLTLDYPNQYKVINRGVSGNRSADIYARLESDVFFFKPDYLTLLMGVNDVWHNDWGGGVSTAKFEKMLKMICEETETAVKGVKIILMSPFVLEGEATVSETDKNRYANFKSSVLEKAEVMKKYAAEKNYPFIELQPIFDNAAKEFSANYLTLDGVHPTPAGHELISRKWMEKFKEIV